MSSHAASELMRPSLRRWLLVLCGSVAFVAIGLWLIPEHPWIAWLSVCFFGLGAAVALINLPPNASYLRLDANGFEVRSLFRTWRTAWRDVAEIGVARPVGREMVVWNYAPGFLGREATRKSSLSVCSFEAGLPDTYGLKAADLAYRMERWRQLHLSRKPGK